jgi:hypothetical protein
VSTPNPRLFLITFRFYVPAPEALLEREYKRFSELRKLGVFKTLSVDAEHSSGTFEMCGDSQAEVESALQSLPLYTFATWHVAEANQS